MAFYAKTVTATDDNPFSFDQSPIVLSNCSIRCKTNGCLFGNQANVVADITPGGVEFYTTDVRVDELWFMNLTAGLNTTIIITGPVRGSV